MEPDKTNPQTPPNMLGLEDFCGIGLRSTYLQPQPPDPTRNDLTRQCRCYIFVATGENWIGEV